MSKPDKISLQTAKECEYALEEFIRKHKPIIQNADSKRPLHFHGLRHSCESVLLDMDVPLKVISQMLGHSSIKVTADIYCAVLEKNKQPAELMQEAFFTG